MAALTVQSPAITGTTLTANAASSSDTFTNSGRTKIIVYNNSGGTRTFDAVTTKQVETDLDVDDRSYSVDNGSYTLIGNFSQDVYSSTVTIENWDSGPTNVFIFVFSDS
jgi:hypothetical protein